MAFDEVLAERVRERLAGRAGVREKRMFGGAAFLTEGHLTVGVYRDDLLVRLDPAEAQTEVLRPEVRPFDMTGRPMRGWVVVAGDSLDDDVLDGWIERAGAFVATLPPK